MKNTILNFDKEELFLSETDLTSYDVPNYFGKNTKISDLKNIISDFDNYLITYRMLDNDKLERISFELYGTTNYWDIIFLINERDPLLNMPYDSDVINNCSTNFIENYFDNIYSEIIPEERKNALADEVLNTVIEQNEEYRFIKVVKPSRIGEFLILLKNNGFI